MDGLCGGIPVIVIYTLFTDERKLYLANYE